MKSPFEGTPTPTPDQAKAILREGHTLLEAGAGSGKTTTVVDKILFLLGAPRIPGQTPRRRCELSEIAAITFTNAAAADLKQKLRKQFRRVADFYAVEENPIEERRWRERVYEIDRARVGTIHSFCGQILREFAFRLGLDPAFKILDEGESGALTNDCASDIVLSALSRDEPHVARLVECLGIDALTKLVAEWSARGDTATEALSVWYKDGEPVLDILKSKVAMERVDWGCDDKTGLWVASADELGARLACVALKLAIATRARVDERLDRTGALDFDGVVIRTRNALRTRPDMVEAIRARLAWLFIDEFQDTDRTQLDIADAICRIRGPVDAEGDGPPWLCIVGDPKQSIYRFRRADVSLWTEVTEVFAARHIAPIPLAENFRSRAPIVGYVNATFGKLLSDESAAVAAAGHAVPFTPLGAHRSFDGDDALVELLVSAEGDAGERREAIATSIVGRIAELRKDDQAIRDDASGAHHSARWKDIALLFRSRTGIAVFEKVLRSFGVPYYIAGGDGFFQRREVRDVRLLLTALANVSDDMAWLGVLRSPFVGITDETLLRFRMKEPAQPLQRLLEMPHAGIDAGAIARARKWIADAEALRDRVTVAELIEFAIAESGYAAQLLAQEHGSIALANLRKLVRLADGLGGASISEFVTYMVEREDGDSREGDAAVFGSDDDVVTITTIHSAKGLEWPVVFLCDIDRDIVNKTKSKPLLVADAAGVGIKVAEPEVFDEPKISGAWGCLVARSEALSRAEEKRLWYVGTTRARDRLILCAAAAAVPEANQVPHADAKKVYHWLLRELNVGDGCFRYGTDQTWAAVETIAVRPVVTEAAAIAIPNDDQLASADLAREAAAQLARQVQGIHPAPALPRRSATELMLLAEDGEAYRRKYVHGLPERRVFARDGDQVPEGVPARVLGDVLHGALEMARSDDDLAHYLEHELTSRTGDSPGSPRVSAAVARLRKLIDQAKAHPAVARLYDAAEVESELPFTWFVRHDGHADVVRGEMDLVARIDGQLEALDFKSHQNVGGKEEEVASSYAVQRDVYLAALHAVLQENPSRFTFFFPDIGKAVPHACNAETITAAEGSVRSLLAAARSGGSGS